MDRRDELGDVQALTIRIPRRLHEQLRLAAFASRRSMNEIVVEVVEKHLHLERAIKQHRKTLDRLADQ